ERGLHAGVLSHQGVDLTDVGGPGLGLAFDCLRTAGHEEDRSEQGEQGGVELGHGGPYIACRGEFASVQSRAMAQRGIPFGRKPGSGPGREGPARPRVLSVREAVELANVARERGVAARWIAGEIRNLIVARSGHAYVTLKDGAAALPAAMWASSVRRLRFRLEEGQRLRVFGRMGIYAAQGRFQFYAERAEPAGLGELTLALEQLKQKLAGEGL